MDPVKDLLRFQDSLIEGLQQENQRWTSRDKAQLEEWVREARVYQAKLMRMEETVRAVSEQTDDMRRRGARLQRHSDQRALEAESKRRQRLDSDQRLEPVIRTTSNHRT